MKNHVAAGRRHDMPSGVNSPAVAQFYRTPTLVKGPVLSDITAYIPVSGVPSDA